MGRARIGSVISGTLRAEDLLRSLADELEARDRAAGYRELVAEARSAEPHSDSAREVLGELEEALGEFALPYCYFGSHRGDAADFGYWPDWDAIEMDRRDGTLPSGDRLPDRKSASGYFLHISDHGNAELYEWDERARRWQSIWGVV